MAEEFVNAISNPIVASGVELLKDLFGSIDSVGPIAYAREADDFEDASLKQREAFERVNELLSKLDGGE